MDPELKTYYVLMGAAAPRFVAEDPADIVAFHEEHPYPISGKVYVMCETGEIIRTVGVSTLANEVQDAWAEAMEEDAEATE